MRLSTLTLDRLPASVARFAYDRHDQLTGIVHLGLGAFHRAHQAWYTDLAMDGGDRHWAIVGASLRSAAVARRINPQDGLYSLTSRSGAGATTRVVGSIRAVHATTTAFGEHDVTCAIAAQPTRIVSLTVTEKGYASRPDGSLDHALARIGFYPLLARGLARRRDLGRDGVTLMSCDNLAGNGARLQRLVSEYLAAFAPDLLPWFESHCACPSTMVDRIVPATTGEDRDEVAGSLGMRDEAAVMTEPYSQWVIEDRFAAGRPRWETVGATLVADVAPFETAKLRMLNGAHSALAYLGLEKGHVFVHQAIADPDLRALVERLVRDEAAHSFAPATGQDLAAYADSLFARFANPALRHRLDQIAADGSQKIPQRWLETIADRRGRGQRSPALLAALAGWVRHVRGDEQTVDDPLAPALASLWQQNGSPGVVPALFARAGPFADALTPLEQEEVQAWL